jgi:prevent-host-death family protein
MEKLADHWSMRKIESSEASSRFLQLLDDVEHGDTLIITRHGKPIARLSPETEGRQAKIKQAMEGIRALRSRSGQITVKEILSARDEGRKR